MKHRALHNLIFLLLISTSGFSQKRKERKLIGYYEYKHFGHQGEYKNYFLELKKDRTFIWYEKNKSDSTLPPLIGSWKVEKHILKLKTEAKNAACPPEWYYFFDSWYRPSETLLPIDLQYKRDKPSYYMKKDKTK